MDQPRYDLKNDHIGKIPIIACLIFTVIIIIVYNLLKYKTLDEQESIPADKIELASARVVVSDHPLSSDTKPIERQNICVLSKSEFITNNDAVDAALGENKEYTARNYRISVFRPCGKQTADTTQPLLLRKAN